MYRKQYPPALRDDVWRLEKISKLWPFHEKLWQHGVETVQEFLRMLMVKPDVLREIMGDGMTDRMWEVCTSHAKTCDAGDKVYAYAGQHGATVYVNSIWQLVKIEFAGVECAAQELAGTRGRTCTSCTWRRSSSGNTSRRRSLPPCSSAAQHGAGRPTSSSGDPDLVPGQLGARLPDCRRRYAWQSDRGRCYSCWN